jgi:hypothetical protein
MQKHLDAIKENHDRLNDFFKGQMEQQFKADADQDRQAKAGSGASPLGGQAK